MISWVSIAVLFVIVAVQGHRHPGDSGRLAGGTGRGARRRAGVRRAAHRPGPADRFLHHHREAVRLRRPRVSWPSAVSPTPAEGTVEDVTLRVTKLRSAEGEMFTIPNGQIVKTLNLSKDWARAVVDIPVPTSADLNKVNDVLHDVARTAIEDRPLKDLLLDAPQLMGVESIELDTVNLRMVARTLARQAVRGGPSAARSRGSWRCVAQASSRPTETPRWSPRYRIRGVSAGEGAETQAAPEQKHDVLAQDEARRPTFGRRTLVLIARVRRAVLGEQYVPAGAGTRGTRSRGRPARLRARPELHLGAAHEGSAAARSRCTRPPPPTPTTTETTTPAPEDTTDEPDSHRARRRRWSIRTAPVALSGRRR